MRRIPADTRAFYCEYCSFEPYGEKSFHGEDIFQNPQTWKADEPIAARLFVGLSVLNEKTGRLTHPYKIRDVIKTVREVRDEQSGLPNSNFISQKGIFRHSKSGRVVEEESVQVVIFFQPTTQEQTKEDFRRNIQSLAERLARVFDQEEVVLEIQARGIAEGAEGWKA